MVGHVARERARIAEKLVENRPRAVGTFESFELIQPLEYSGIAPKSILLTPVNANRINVCSSAIHDYNMQKR